MFLGELFRYNFKAANRHHCLRAIGKWCAQSGMEQVKEETPKIREKVSGNSSIYKHLGLDTKLNSECNKKDKLPAMYKGLPDELKVMLHVILSGYENEFLGSYPHSFKC